MSDRQTFVIVGAGLAGAKAAETLREEGFDGRIVLIGSEPERPYERPPLSKEYLRGEAEAERTRVHAEGFYDEQEIELWTGRTVTALCPGAREVELDGAERLRFDRLLLATGAEPRRLRVPGAELDGVHVLRDLAHATALRERLEPGARLVVVGGGWIGSEVAASARERGLDVTIVEQLTLPLERVLGPRVAAIYRDIHIDHGVTVLGDAALRAFEGQGHVRAVRLADGDTLACDLVVVGVGVAPRVELARDAGLAVEDGVTVDARLESSVPGIFAAGDVASFPHPLFGRLRIEHWANALHQGPAAARSMLGGREPYERVPYFFSDQYDVGMEYSGFASGGDEVVFRGDPASREFTAFWLRDKRVRAAMNVNVWGITQVLQALILSTEPVDRARLGDPDVPLVEMAGVRG